MAQTMRVLVTGSAGAVGKAVVEELQRRGHTVRGLDIQRSPGLEGEASRVANLTDAEAVMDAVDGMDAVVHLAATPDDDDFHQKLLPNNVEGLYNVFHACREHKVKRLVAASSCQVLRQWQLQQDRPVRVEDGTGPSNHYALTKVWAEAMGRMYHETYDLSVIMVRIGWLPRHPIHTDAIRKSDASPLYLSHGDAGRFFAQAVEARDVGFAILFATSKPPAEPPVDLDTARDLIGYEPQDVFPEGLPEQAK